MQVDEVKSLIAQVIPNAEIEVIGENDHFQVQVISECFDGMTSIERQRLIYSALGDRIGREIHALSMQTLTPEEFASNSKFRVTSE